MTLQAKFRFWKRSSLTFPHKIMLVKAATENFDSFLFKTFKLNTKRDIDKWFGCMLLLITMIVWLHVYPFIAKTGVIFQTARARPGKSEIHKKAMTKIRYTASRQPNTLDLWYFLFLYYSICRETGLVNCFSRCFFNAFFSEKWTNVSLCGREENIYGWASS